MKQYPSFKGRTFTIKRLPSRLFENIPEKDRNFLRPQRLFAARDAEHGILVVGLNEDRLEELSKHFNKDLTPYISTPEGEPHPFWSDKDGSVELPVTSRVLNGNIPLQEIQMALCWASPYVANSLVSHQEGEFPMATHYIEDEEEVVKQKVSKHEVLSKARKALYKSSKQHKIQVLYLLKNRNYSQQSDEALEAILEDELSSNTAEYLRVSELDNSIMAGRVQILQAVEKSILNKEKGSYLYMQEIIGTNLASACDWFLDPANSIQRAEIVSKLETV